MIAMGKKPVSNADQDTFVYTLWDVGEAIWLMLIDYKGAKYALQDKIGGPDVTVLKDTALPNGIVKLPVTLDANDCDRRHLTAEEIKLVKVAFGVTKFYRKNITVTN